VESSTAAAEGGAQIDRILGIVYVRLVDQEGVGLQAELSPQREVIVVRAADGLPLMNGGPWVDWNVRTELLRLRQRRVKGGLLPVTRGLAAAESRLGAEGTNAPEELTIHEHVADGGQRLRGEVLHHRHRAIESVTVRDLDLVLVRARCRVPRKRQSP